MSWQGQAERNVAVEAALRERIADEEQITFAKFMDICLYSSEGYYASCSAIGQDFATAPEAHPAFGHTIANAILDLTDSPDRPQKLLEMGAGNGNLAKDILRGLGLPRSRPQAQYSYNIVEISPSLNIHYRKCQ